MPMEIWCESPPRATLPVICRSLAINLCCVVLLSAVYTLLAIACSSVANWLINPDIDSPIVVRRITGKPSAVLLIIWFLAPVVVLAVRLALTLALTTLVAETLRTFARFRDRAAIGRTALIYCSVAIATAWGVDYGTYRF